MSICIFSHQNLKIAFDAKKDTLTYQITYFTPHVRNAKCETVCCRLTIFVGKRERKKTKLQKNDRKKEQKKVLSLQDVKTS